MANRKTSTRTKKTTLKKSSRTKVAPKPKKTEKCEVSHFVGISIIIAGLVIMAAFICGLIKCFTKQPVVSDAEKFSAEYTSVEEDNLFVFKTNEEIIEILEHGTGVVFLGFPSCPWCQAYAPMLNNLAKEAGIDTIYYRNILEDRQNGTEGYQKIVEILGANLQFDEEGNRRIYVPNTVFIKDGVIIGNDFETSLDTLGAETPEDYWTEERISAFNSRISGYLAQLQ